MSDPVIFYAVGIVAPEGVLIGLETHGFPSDNERHRDKLNTRFEKAGTKTRAVLVKCEVVK